MNERPVGNQRRRWVTRSGIDVVTCVVGINLLVFAYMVTLPTESALLAFIQTGAISVEGLKSGAWWQVVTHLFIHGGNLGTAMRLIHLAVNLLIIYQVGKELLSDVGSKHWLGIYGLSGILGGLLQILVTPESPLLGASAAAFGLMTAYCSIHAFEILEVWVLGFPMRLGGAAFGRGLVVSSAALGFLSLANFGAVPFLTNIGHWAHLGGALGGVAYVRLLGLHPRTLTRDDILEERVLNDARLKAKRVIRSV